MKYIVLLRGVNVSGKNKLPMSALKKVLEENDYREVMTYLNSGNVILESASTAAAIASHIRALIGREFSLDIPVLAIASNEVQNVLAHQPDWWNTSDKNIYDNLIFVMPPATSQEVCDIIGDQSAGIEQIQPYQNVIFWSFALQHYQQANWWRKTASLPIKDQLTIRTARTVTKLFEICEDN